MARTRDAVDTIKGYYYQFDYFILQIIDSLMIQMRLQ